MHRNKYILILFFFKLDFVNLKFTFRSIGGRDALKGEFPFILRLAEIEEDMEDYFFCTGSALTPTWGLTAAHCVKGYAPDKDKIKAEWYNHLDVNHMGESEILSFVTHPRYHVKLFGNTRHDIALFETKQTMTGVTFAKLSCFDYVSLDGLRGFGAGYGIRNVTESQTTLQVVEGMFSRCGKIVRRWQSPCICLMPLCSVRAGGASFSYGDSGGPVVHATGIVGIVAAGIPPDAKRTFLKPFVEFPLAIVAPISPYLNWISDVISGTRST